MLSTIQTKHDKPLSNLASNCKLRQYAKGVALVSRMDALYHPNPPASSAAAASSAASSSSAASPQLLDRAGVTSAYFAHAHAVLHAWCGGGAGPPWVFAVDSTLAFSSCT